LHERIKIDAHQVDIADAMLLHCRHMFRQVAPAKHAAVNFRMQRFHPAIQHFRKTGVIGHFDHLDAVFRQQLGGAPGGKDFNSETGQRPGKLQYTLLVGNTDKSALNFGHHGDVGLSLPKDRKKRAGSAQIIFLELFAQGVAIDTEQLCGLGLVTLGMRQHDFQQGSFDAGHHHIVNGTGRLSVQVAKILLHRPLDCSGDLFFVVIHDTYPHPILQ
jgi:hypothetical protein